MIEANNPEINVDELIEKVQDEVAKRKASCIEEENYEYMINPDKQIIDVSPIEALINNAEFKAQVRTHWPKKFERFPLNIGWLQKFSLKLYNFLLKEQRVVNFSLSQALRESLALNRQLSEQVAALQMQVNQISDRLNATAVQVNQSGDRLNTTEVQVNQISDRLNATEVQVNQSGDRLNITEQGLHRISDRLNATSDRLNATSDRLNATSESLHSIDERYNRNDSYLKNDLAQQKRLITLFLEEARQRLPETFNQEQLQTFLNEEQHLLDAFYLAFENRFRGTREDVTEKLKVHLPLIAQAKIGTPDAYILDVGCGRGEWLELLHENGYTAKGIDINRAMIEQCQARGLEVMESEVIAYLQSLPDASLGAVTGFHIIEHLPFPLLLKLFSEVARVLQPNGLAIFETPNPQNLLVGACDFYSDPTHQRPLYPETIQFLLFYQGLSNVQLLHLNPVENSPFDQQNPGTMTLHNWFCGPRDYAVIGYKL